MSTQIPMDPPKLFCMPARPLVCGLALFGAIRSLIQFFMAHGITVGLSHICVLLLDLLLLFGAYKNDVFALKWSQRVTFMCVLISIARFLIYPVVFASYIASGLSRNFTGLDASDIEMISNVTSAKDNFVFGMVSGFTLEFATGLSIGVECMKYFLVHRLWEYAKVTEAISSSRYVIP
ncbi:hypothetical protein B9Z55_010664 [Caenorhabditis nigoni]|uniref:Uncharacterized protein n=1 Tax=Caenorhabditis nigoni TaxID=1611254 RepID=A0A2G5UGT5_9PELO|nr:hypothetical protein B9Z55_010664 [Caenorhabditis nigoni]